jgi:hypothetical protein
MNECLIWYDIESGVQHKAVVEYAPSQRVPKKTTKKDGREGTIYKGTSSSISQLLSRLMPCMCSSCLS